MIANENSCQLALGLLQFGLQSPEWEEVTDGSNLVCLPQPKRQPKFLLLNTNLGDPEAPIFREVFVHRIELS